MVSILILLALVVIVVVVGRIENLGLLLNQGQGFDRAVLVLSGVSDVLTATMVDVLVKHVLLLGRSRGDAFVGRVG